MLNERRNAAISTATAFLSAERAVEEAATLSARCVATMVEQRVLANLPIDTAAVPLQLIADAMHDVLTARQKMLDAHALLRDVPARIGLKTVDFGDQGCPPNEPFTSAATPLKVVG